MDREELLEGLGSLAQMDIDAVYVYEEAMEHVDDSEVSDRFARFHDQHRHHAERLSETISRLGGEPPEMKVDTMGRLADWYTAVRSISGTEGALHAMESAEKYHNRRYSEAADQWDVGDVELDTTLDRFYEDECLHLTYVTGRLGRPVSAR